MRTTLYAAFRHEFIAVSGESRPGKLIEIETTAVL